MLLSILVPVYNVEAVLERCITSLVELSLPDYEIILIDDGSTDRSGEICDTWEEKCDYVKVIHKKNKGLVAARDTALAIAKGKYVTFVDSDDWVDRGLLPCLVMDLETYPDVDIAVGTVVRNADAETDLPHLSRNTGKLTKEQAVKAMVKKEGMHWYLCGKVFRRTLFLGLEVDTKVTVFEDLDRIWPVVGRARNFFFDDKYSYHYFVNLEGLTKKRCDLNPNSWRVFQRILLSEDIESVRQDMINFYVQIFLRHTLEMYFVNRVSFRSEIESYIAELKETMLQCGATQTIISDEDYQSVSTSYDTCIAFYDQIFEQLRSLLITVRNNHRYMYVYGTGVVTQYVMAVMQEMGVYTDAFIVSDGEPKLDRFMDRKVFYFSEVNLNSDTAVVLALTGKAEKQVKDILQTKNDEVVDGKARVYSIGFPPMIF